MLASHRDEVTLPEDVDASGDSTQKVRESVEALSTRSALIKMRVVTPPARVYGSS